MGKAIRTGIRFQRCLLRTSCDPDKETGSKDAVGEQICRAQALGSVKEKGQAEDDRCQASGRMAAGTVHQESFGSYRHDGSGEQ